VPVGVKHCIDVVAGPDALASLMAPNQVLAVVALGKQAIGNPFPFPRANVPRCAEGSSVVVELLFGVIDAKNDFAFPAVVDRLLLERN
jgi:hypothetical protein